MDLRDVHHEYVVGVMEQDPKVIQEMCYLLDDIQVMMFVSSVDIAVCSSLVNPISTFITDVEQWMIDKKNK